MVTLKEAMKCAEQLDAMMAQGWPMRTIRRSRLYKNFKRFFQERRRFTDNN